MFGLFSLAATCKERRAVFSSIKSTACFLKRRVVGGDRYSLWFMWSAIALLVWLFLLADTPVRAADAMRYHLPLLKDLVVHHGDVFRPYLHYNSPN